jgi:hypothetical protein
MGILHQVGKLLIKGVGTFAQTTLNGKTPIRHRFSAPNCYSATNPTRDKQPSAWIPENKKGH